MNRPPESRLVEAIRPIDDDRRVGQSGQIDGEVDEVCVGNPAQQGAPKGDRQKERQSADLQSRHFYLLNPSEDEKYRTSRSFNGHFFMRKSETERLKKSGAALRRPRRLSHDDKHFYPMNAVNCGATSSRRTLEPADVEQDSHYQPTTEILFSATED